MTSQLITGGCQCGAIRYRIGRLGRPAICHCRMCQKALGNVFGAFVTAHDLTWTKGSPRTYQSSNVARRGFCADCGTPLTYDWGGPLEIAIGTLDDMEAAAPVLQVNVESRASFFGHLHTLPEREDPPGGEVARFKASVKSRQHPDSD